MPSKLYRLAAIAALAFGAALLAIVVASPSEPKSEPSTAARDAAALVSGIPERDGVLGDPAAPVTVTEFVDLQCPVCAVTAAEILPTVIENYVRPGKVKLELRTLHFLGPDSERAARVAAGAERQGRLWAFTEAFYAAQGQENSGYVTDDFLRGIAAAAGVDAAAALEQAGSDRATKRLERANADAQALGVSGTPTFAVKRGDGQPQVVEAGSLLAALEREAR
jgi:protein-disulfide isomerase